MKNIYIFALFALSLSMLTLVCLNRKHNASTINSNFHNLFPKTENDIICLTNQAINEARQSLTALVSIPREQKNFNNTVQAFDTIKNRFLNTSRVIGLIPTIYSVKDLGITAQEQSIAVQKAEFELFERNQKLFDALSWYSKHKAPYENLTEDQSYFLELLLNSFKILSLSSEQQQKASTLKEKINALEIEFQQNISIAGDTNLLVTHAELNGLPESFTKQLERTSKNLYKLPCNYNTYMKIITNCSVGTTREKMYKFFHNRAHPDNASVLKELLTCKNNLAQLLGHPTAAHLELYDTMAKNPEDTEIFLNNLAQKVQEYETQEFLNLKANLPQDISLSPEGKLYPWDRNFLMEQFKKYRFSFNQEEIAEYFPLEATLKKILFIYEEFLDIHCSFEPLQGLWGPHFYLVSLYQDKTVIGHLILDLFYRPNKYHNACHITVTTPQHLNDGTINPGTSLVLANFDKPDNNCITLITHEDVATTLFHEIGHALHGLLGAAPFATLSGTNVKRDFVEVPSQMFEEWAWDAAILKRISSHYKTGKPLPDKLITILQTSKNFMAAALAQKQIFYSLMSLLFFKDGAHKDLHTLFKEIYLKVRMNDFYCPDDYSYLAFGHFISYDAKYYSYVWSKVIALDLFETIKKTGLTNPSVGSQFKKLVLQPGGSKDPNELVANFLGRSFNDTAYVSMLRS